ncbi:hypothetical protein K504DRAFT_520380 [Pleomassaria siparia CBS 279.74]|uniref:Mid2 domain-containing protein n=1 Tax=Pleomassaria siparia CBS 279.74 TaxID=1314801 RepID=A0A6G1JRK1_9PLEO|nr:hypothetical protein K504DRAFT_520380 [Pleomassaria siparia CBS 279.74]
MFRWRTWVSILFFASLLALFFSPLGNQQSNIPSKRVQKVNHQGGSIQFFGTHPPVTQDRVSYESGLYRRDVCSDTFPGRVSQTCSPSSTLCCIIPGEKIPECTTILGYGFCCTENSNCFVDLTSACASAGSSQCAAGLCCPAQTTCVSDFTYSNKSLVRCNVNSNLIPPGIASLASSSRTASATAKSSTSPTSRAASKTKSAATAPVPHRTSALSSTDSGGNTSLTGAAIAGIAVGVVAFFAICAVAGLLMWRKRKGDRAITAAAVGPTQPLTYNPIPQDTPHEMGHTEQVYEAPAQGEYYGQRPVPKATYANQGGLTQELGTEGQRHEMA